MTRDQLLDLTVAIFFREYYKPNRLRSCSPLTPGCFLTPIAALGAFWRSLDPSRTELTMRDFYDKELIAKYLDSMKVERATQNKHLRHLKAVWNFGVDEYDLHPKRLSLKEVDEHRRKPRCWSQDEFTKLLFAAAETPGHVGDVPARYWWPALILMVYSTGVRISAVMSIRTNDLDLEHGQVLIRAEAQKDKSDQLFDLIPEAIAVVRMIRPDRHICVFDDWPYDRHVPQWKTLNKHYRRILARAGLPALRIDLWHKVRKTFGTEVARVAGKAVAQALLGHSHPSVTDRYLDDRFLDVPRAAELLRRPALPIQLRLFKPDDDPPPAAKAG